MEIVQATRTDAAEILALQKLAYQSEAELYSDFSIEPLTQTIEGIETEFNTRTVLKAVAHGRIIGSVRAHETDGSCFIGKLIVRPGHQNRGLGTRLMNEIESVFPAAKRFELFTGARSQRNLHLYAKLGYKPFAEKAANKRLTLIFLEKAGPIRNRRG